MNNESKSASEEEEDSLRYLNEAIDLSESLVVEEEEVVESEVYESSQKEKTFVDEAELKILSETWSRKSPPANNSGLNDANSFLFVQPYWGGNGGGGVNDIIMDNNKKLLDSRISDTFSSKMMMFASSNVKNPSKPPPPPFSFVTNFEKLKENQSPPTINISVLKEKSSLQINVDVCNPGKYVLIDKTNNTIVKNFRESNLVVFLPLEFGVEKTYAVMNALKNNKTIIVI